MRRLNSQPEIKIHMLHGLSRPGAPDRILVLPCLPPKNPFLQKVPGPPTVLSRHSIFWEPGAPDSTSSWMTSAQPLSALTPGCFASSGKVTSAPQPGAAGLCECARPEGFPSLAYRRWLAECPECPLCDPAPR